MKRIFTFSKTLLKSKPLLLTAPVILSQEELEKPKVIVKQEQSVLQKIEQQDFDRKSLLLTLCSYVIDCLLYSPTLIFGLKGLTLYYLLFSFRGYGFSLGNYLLKLKFVNSKGETPTFVETLKRNYFACLFTLLCFTRVYFKDQKKFQKGEMVLVGSMFFTDLYSYYYHNQPFGEYLSKTKSIQI